MKKTIIILTGLMISCCYVIGAEEVTEPVSNGSWVPVMGEAVRLLVQVVGAGLIALISAIAWKLLGKFGIEKNVAMDSLLRTYIKQGINYADSWASTQSAKPIGDEKLAAAVKHIIELVANSTLTKVAEEKLKEMVEAQLAFDKKQANIPDTAPKVISE